MASANSTSTNGTATIIDNAYYYYQNDGASGAAVYEPDGSLQFTVAPGDFWQLDPTDVNRSEIAGSTQYANQTTVNVAYTVKVSGGINPDPNGWEVIGQFHQNDGPNTPHNAPPFSVRLVQGKMEIGIGYTDASGKDVFRTIWTDANTITQGKPYAMSIQATFDPNGNGHLVVSRNGVELVAYSGALGYDSQSSVYWKEGIYRSLSDATMVANYSNLSVTSLGAQTAAAATAAASSNVFSTTTDYDPTTGALASKTVLYRDNSSVEDIFANGRTAEHLETSASGNVTLLERFNGDGSLLFKQQVNADGSQTTQNFSNIGVLQQTKIASVDGSRVYYDYAAVGYQSIVTYINAKGVTNEVDQTFSDGSMRIAEYYPSGQPKSSEVTFYSAAKTKVSEAITYPNGTRDIYQYGITNAAYTGTLTRYNAQGATTELQQIFADGSKHVADYGASADNFTSKVTFYNAAGTVTSATIAYKNGASETDTFNAGVMTQKVVNGTDGSQTTDTYSMSGALQQVKVVAKDGSRVYTDYAAAGYNSIVTQINASGVTTEVDQIYTDASKRVSLYGTMALQGYSSQVTLYNAKGTKTSQTVAYGDGSRDVYQYGITNAAYTGTLTRYNAQGATTELQQIFADGSKHVADYGASADSFTSKVTFYNAAGAVTSATIAYKNGSSETDTFNAGVMTQKVVNGTDGSQTTDTYSTSGALQQMKVIAKDGSRVYTDYTAAGYNSIVTQINASGVTTEVDQIGTDGSKRISLYGTMALQGYSSQVTLYNAKGTKTSQTVVYGDGSRDIYQYGITNAAYTGTLTRYNAQGATTELQQIFADGSKHVADYGASADSFTSKVTVYNTAGAVTSATVAYKNGSSETDTFNAGVMTQKVVNGTDGSQTTDTYSTSGALQQMKVVAEDGSRVYTDYTAAGYNSIVTQINASGVTTEVDQIGTDGSKRIANFAISGQTYTSQVSLYNAAGVLTNLTRNHADGTLDYTNTLGSNGTRTVSTYDNTGKMTSSAATAVDGTVTAKALAAGISMVASPNNETFTSYHNDTFVFSSNFGQDTISGFNAGSGSFHDAIQLNKSQVADFAHLAVAQSGADAVISLSPHETIKLQGVQASTLTASNFNFA